MNGRRLMVVLLAALALLAAGCGGDDSNEAAGETDTTVVEETTGSDATETTDDSSATGTGDDEDAELSGECAELLGLGTKITQAMSGGNEGLDEASALFDELAGQVPDEIKADFEVIAENFSKIAEALKDVDVSSGATPSQEDIERLQELTASLNSEEVQQASENIEAWAEKNC